MEFQLKDSYMAKSSEQRNNVSGSDISYSSDKDNAETAIMVSKPFSSVSDLSDLLEWEYVVVDDISLKDSYMVKSSKQRNNVSGSDTSYSSEKAIAENAVMDMSDLSDLLENEYVVVDDISFKRSSKSSSSGKAVETSESYSEEKEMSSLTPSMRLRSLAQHIQALSNLVQDKLGEDKLLESFSVMLLVLVIWKEAIRICQFWKDSTGKVTFVQESEKSVSCVAEDVNFDNLSSVRSWAQRGFITACEQAKKIRRTIVALFGDGVKMPNAIDIIFNVALALGNNKVVEGNNAELSYEKAVNLLTFIVEVAPTLPLTPPFSLRTAEQQRLKGYIVALRKQQHRLRMADASSASATNLKMKI